MNEQEATLDAMLGYISALQLVIAHLLHANEHQSPINAQNLLDTLETAQLERIYHDPIETQVIPDIATGYVKMIQALRKSVSRLHT